MEVVRRKPQLDAVVRRLCIDIEVVFREARERNEHELDALRRECVTAGPIVEAARAARLNDATMVRIRDEGEIGEGRLEVAAVSQATREQVERRAAAEADAREWLVDVDATRRVARKRNADEVEAVEQETAKVKPVVKAARAAGLDDAVIVRIHDEGESEEAGSGWAAVSQATREPVERRAVAEADAREWLVDVDAVRRVARERNADEVEAVEQETAKVKPVVKAARAAGLDDAVIVRIHDEGESEEASGGSAGGVPMPMRPGNARDHREQKRDQQSHGWSM